MDAEGSVVSKIERILVPQINLVKKTYNRGECQVQQCLRSQNQYHQL